MELEKASGAWERALSNDIMGQAFPSKSLNLTVLPLSIATRTFTQRTCATSMRILWLWASRICRQSQRALWDLPTSHSMRTWLCYWPSVSFESYTQSPIAHSLLKESKKLNSCTLDFALIKSYQSHYQKLLTFGWWQGRTTSCLLRLRLSCLHLEVTVQGGLGGSWTFKSWSPRSNTLEIHVEYIWNTLKALDVGPFPTCIGLPQLGQVWQLYGKVWQQKQYHSRSPAFYQYRWSCNGCTACT